MESKRLTDEIYSELVEGLKTSGLDWTAFIAKHNAHKSELYDAIGRFFGDMGPKVRALSEVQTELDAARVKLGSLDQGIKEAESNIAVLGEKRNVLNDQIGTLETKVAEKSEFIKQVRELEKLGFDIEKLRQLKDALTEIGAKCGFKGKEAVRKFFDDLKDYGAVVEAELLLKGLQTQIETKRLEAENWQTKEEILRTQHNDLKDDIAAVRYLRTRNVKVGQPVAWQRILSRFETIDQFEEYLAQYADVTKLLNAKKEEAGSYELRVTKARSQLETLEKERAKIEAEIESLRVTGVKQLGAMTEASEKQLKVLAASEIREARAIGQEIRSELDKLLEKAVHLGEELERSKQKLQKYERVKNVLESHAVTSETGK